MQLTFRTQIQKYFKGWADARRKGVDPDPVMVAAQMEQAHQELLLI